MSLAPIRSLSSAGYNAICGEYNDIDDSLLLGSRSKYSGGLIRYDKETAAESIYALCDTGDVVLPVGRATIRSFGAHPEISEKVNFLASSSEILDKADDKAYVRELARKLGIPAPETFYPKGGETDIDFSHRVNYPAIVKYKNGEALGLKSWERYSIAKTPEELVTCLKKMRSRSDELLVQDYLTGQDVGAAVVMDKNSRPVDFILYVSDREYPLSGGPTCLCRTVFNRDLLKYACSILTELKFQGIAMLDFKGTVDKPYLLEINPRIWGSAELCHVAKSSFFESYVKASLGSIEPLDLDTCEPSYKIGARMKFMPHCLMAVLSEIKSGNVKSGLRDLASSLSFGVKDGLFEHGDAKPFNRYMINLFSGKG
jgi:predicted ATP-grasp superfamily ATP-dependent carboligase